MIFNFFKDKEIIKLAKESIGFTNSIFDIFTILEKKKKKISKKDVLDALSKYRIGVIEDGLLKESIDLVHTSSHRWINANIRPEDRKDWSKYTYQLNGIMIFSGVSIYFDYKTKEKTAHFISNNFLPKGEKGRELHNEIVKLSGYKELIDENYNL
jgi:hypothetical protein